MGYRIMLLSKELNFIFIHIYKNAGTSIRQSLLPIANQVMQTRMNVESWLDINAQTYDLMPYPAHISASEVIQEIGQSVFDSYYSFAVVRNPWDWQVSLYNFMYHHSDHPLHEEIRGIGGFDNYIDSLCTRRISQQKLFICSEEGRLLVDKVLRFENICLDFSDVCSELGIRASLQHANAFSHDNYREYYSQRSIDSVAAVFREDIEFFGYDF